MFLKASFTLVVPVIIPSKAEVKLSSKPCPKSVINLLLSLSSAFRFSKANAAASTVNCSSSIFALSFSVTSGLCARASFCSAAVRSS